MRIVPLLALFSLAACEPEADLPKDSGTVNSGADGDEDGDGTTVADGDCNDNDATVNPEAAESCDLVDNDCDGLVDEDVGTPYWPDADGDAWGSGEPVLACSLPAGHAEVDGDCNDGDPAVHPEASEVCNSVDDDCDSEVDENVGSAWYVDADADGYGDPRAETMLCDGASGFVDNATDCDDSDDTVWPGAAEVCDVQDNNCDGAVDEGVTRTFYVDIDGDGHGLASVTLDACTVPTGYAESADDCDDGNAAVNPAAAELCNTLDDDCDGDTDEDSAVDAPTWYLDADGDGFGEASSGAPACTAAADRVADSTDCDDTDAAENPAAYELCDGDDDDCDGDIDEDSAVDAPTWYADADGDSYGNPTFTTVACAQPARYVADGTDCDDGEAANNPAAAELCDGEDNDCDGDSDEASATDATTWYADTDGDLRGDPATATAACDAPAGHVSNGEDCDDTNVSVFPGATELCNGEDDDCDGDTDEASAVDVTTWYPDGDGDGYGGAGATTLACDQPAGHAALDGDCDDGASGVNPVATETCDGADDDCDAEVDEGVLGSGAACAAESCQAVLDAGASSGDGTYFLDPTGSGSASSWLCDMTTDGGGWTNIVYWDRINDGDDATDLASELTIGVNTMTRYTSGTSYLEWADYNANTDLITMTQSVSVPNGGEVLMDLYLYGYSMDDSGVYAYVTAGGVDQNLLCRSDLDFGSSSSYSSSELSYRPGYSCSLNADTTWTWSGEDQYVVSGEITAFELDGFMYDSYGDYVRLYNLIVWVR